MRRPHTTIIVFITISALSAGSRRAMAATYQQTVLADNPVGYWRFDDAPGSTTTTNLGSQGSSLNGSYQDVALGQPTATPQLGHAAHFNGSNSVVNLAAPISTWLNQTASLEFWFKTTQNIDQDWNSPGVTGEDHSGDPIDVFWGINKAGHVGVQRGDGTVNEAAVTPTQVNDGVWHYLVVTRDKPSGVMKAYLDGNPNPVATVDGADNVNVVTTYSWIGRGTSNTGSSWGGELDEVAVYDYVLTGQQVQTHYAAAAVPQLNILTAIELRWVSLTNQTYQPQYSSNLVDWVDFGNLISSPLGMTNHVFDSTDPARKFYRLNVQ
jgi:concanavalin A-like lectin/glucanase superfamily protein